MTSSPSGYPVAPPLLGAMNPRWSICRPASVHRTMSSVFSLVWHSLMTEVCESGVSVELKQGLVLLTSCEIILSRKIPKGCSTSL